MLSPVYLRLPLKIMGDEGDNRETLLQRALGVFVGGFCLRNQISNLFLLLKITGGSL